jgi:hypothetical protein
VTVDLVESAVDLKYALSFPSRCCEEVTRASECQPCDKPAVAVRRDPAGGDSYPVCAYHARGEMVPLPVVLAAAKHLGWRWTS